MPDILALHRHVNHAAQSTTPATGTGHAGAAGRSAATLGATADAPAATLGATADAPAATLGATADAPAARLAALVRAKGLTGLVRPASAHVGEADPVGERMLPVLPELRELLPGGGLRRGSTVAVAVATGAGDPAKAGDAVRLGATSVLFVLLAAASATGCWCAVVGVPTFGAVAAAEIGIVLDRLALVPHPGPEWPGVVAALLDGVDVVVVAPVAPVAASLAGRLAARARQRGSVLVPYGQWSGADVVLETPGGGWQGLGRGRGRLRARELVICARGRGSAARPRRVIVWLPRDAGSQPPVLAAGAGPVGVAEPATATGAAGVVLDAAG